MVLSNAENRIAALKNDYRVLETERDNQASLIVTLQQERDQWKLLARSAEDDCQRAITRSQKADLDLKCLQESTVDSKAYDTANKRIAELEEALKELDACMDFNEEVQPGEMGIESPENINAASKKAAALIAQQEQAHD